MSAIGSKLGVVSLGMCCQSTFQIRENVAVIAAAAGDEDLKISGMPFDGLICPPPSAAKMLAANAFYPADPNDLDVGEGAYWRDFDVYFWHEYRAAKPSFPLLRSAKLDERQAYRDLSGRYRHLGNKFRQIGRVERLVFVICNSQSNLPLIRELTGTVDYVLSVQAVEELCDACDTFFGKPCEYIFATYADRVIGSTQRENLSVFHLRPDDSEWTGDSAQWAELFRTYFAAPGAEAQRMDDRLTRLPQTRAR